MPPDIKESSKEFRWKMANIGNFHQRSSNTADQRYERSLPSSSVNLVNRVILNTIATRAIVTRINNANPNQPNTIAAVPTPLLTDPLPKSCATCAAATEAVCCHNTETSTKTEAMKARARAP